jgi:hypothetical protein
MPDAVNTLIIRDSTFDSDWQRTALLTSDWHWDNPHCDRRLLKRHLDQAMERNADIFVFGDMLCLMQGKFDPRADKAALREEHRGAAYFHLVRDDVIEWLRPYAPNIRLISRGNHEQETVRRHEVDLLADIGSALNIPVGGYAGYVFWRLEHPAGGKRRTIKCYYHHGAGGGGEMTKGMLKTVRIAAYTPDADICVRGHIHERYPFPLMRYRVSASGQTYMDEQWHIQCGTYKNESTLSGGFHVERERTPRSVGGYWLRMAWQAGSPRNVAIEVTNTV